MVGRLSDVDDIVTLFMKIKREPGSRTGSKHTSALTVSTEIYTYQDYVLFSYTDRIYKYLVM